MDRAIVIPQRLIDIGLSAGREVMSVYADAAFAATRKSDGSPVTEADQRAEAVILAGLALDYPGIPVVAEEEVSAGRIPFASESFFLVDPLDGTREFIERNGEFTVNIALVEAGMPVMGVVYAPALGELYAAADGTAWRGDVKGGVVGALSPIRVRAAPPRIAVVASRANCGDETHEWLRSFDVGSFLSRGSSLKFCLIAAGEADLYPRFGRTMEWDTAAGDAVLRAAGGLTTTVDGKPLVYGRREETFGHPFANPSFIASGDAALRPSKSG